MHPTAMMMIAAMKEQDRERERRMRHAWRQAASPPRPTPPARDWGRRLPAALARTVGLLGSVPGRMGREHG